MDPPVTPVKMKERHIKCRGTSLTLVRQRHWSNISLVAAFSAMKAKYWLTGLILCDSLFGNTLVTQKWVSGTAWTTNHRHTKWLEKRENKWFLSHHRRLDIHSRAQRNDLVELRVRLVFWRLLRYFFLWYLKFKTKGCRNKVTRAKRDGKISGMFLGFTG